MTSLGSEQSYERLQEFKEGLKQINLEVTYFTATLRDDYGKTEMSFQSIFAGFPESVEPGEGIELRRARPVSPDNMIKMWEGVGQDWMVVNNDVQFILFIRRGGNALIAEDLARMHYADHVEPHECISTGVGGFIWNEPDAPDLTIRSRRKQKQRIRERDGHQCQLCGVQPTGKRQTKLEVHHIRPFSQGGPTVDTNLITLCSNCNQALGEEFWPDLYWTKGGPISSATDREGSQAHQRSVEMYGRRMARIFKALRDRG